MNLFNMINCRVVDDKDFNIFAGIWKNIFFILVIAFEFFLTWLMVDIGATTIGSSLIGTANMNAMDHLICWLIGATVLPIGALIKLIPVHKFDKMNDHFDLEDETGGKLNALHNKVGEHYNKARNSIGIATDHPINDTTGSRNHYESDSQFSQT